MLMAAVALLLFAALTTAAAPAATAPTTPAAAAPPAPPLALPSQEDWHHPAEEPVEMAALMGPNLRVTQLWANSNASGVITLRAANGTYAEARLAGDNVFG
jgi:hypothetical protein